MAKLIVKVRYLKKGSKPHSKNLVKYIAQREGVEKIDDTWKFKPETIRQAKLIDQLISDFPNCKDSFEYQDYEKEHTQGTASEFIQSSIEENIDLIGKRKNYVEYIAKRPHAVREGTHGLFTDNNIPIDLRQVANEVANHEGNIFTIIVSLKREDAIETGYDKAKAWRELARNQIPNIAEAMGVQTENLQWYAAFHDEGYHPHMHMIIFAKGEEPYLKVKGIQKIKSSISRQIFGSQMTSTYEKQTQYRDELKETVDDMLKNMMQQSRENVFNNDKITELLMKLASSLKDYKGKKVYGYLPKNDCIMINSIVDELENNSEIKKLYDLWYEKRDEVVGIYQDKKADREPLSQNREFKHIKNLIVKEVFNMINKEITFEDFSFNQDDNSESDIAEKQYEMAKEFLTIQPSRERKRRGVSLLKQSAKSQNAKAEYQLGKMLLYGIGVQKNQKEGLRLLLNSAKKNNVYAKSTIENYLTENKHPNIGFASFRLFCYIADLFENNIENYSPDFEKTDVKSQSKTNEKKQLHGLRIE